MRPNARKQAAHVARVQRKAAKRQRSVQAALKRRRTRQQTPELWRSRVKGRAVRKRPAVVVIAPYLPLAA